MMEAIGDDSGIHLIPCTSKEEKSIFSRLVENGLAEAEVRAEASDTTDTQRTKDVQQRALESEIDALQSATAGGERIKCWPIQESTWDQHHFSKNDVALFYQGTYRYNYGGVVLGAVKAPTVSAAIFGSEDDKQSRPYFLVFGDVYNIDIHSKVLAEYADHDLDYIVSPVSLSKENRREIAKDYGAIEEFVQKARLGIATRPMKTKLENPVIDNGEPLELIEPTPISENDDADDLSEDTTSVDQVESVETDPTDTSPEDETADRTPGDDVDKTDTGSINTSAGKTSDDAEIDEPGSTGTVSEELPDLSTGTTFGGKSETESGKNRISDEITAIQASLKERKLVTLVGPKNTGKRAIAHQIADRWLEDKGRVKPKNRVAVTNFRPDLTYREFVVGHSTETEKNHVPITGEFGKFCDLAAADELQYQSTESENPPRYVMIIEDFHVVDATTVFGNLWQLLQPTNRGRENRVAVTGTETNLWIPEELHVIGIVDTNYADTQLPPAVRRNFHVTRTMPDYETLAETYGFNTLSELETATLSGSFEATSVLALKELNERIRESESLGPDFQLGEKYLCNGTFEYRPLEETRLKRAWSQEIFADAAMYYKGGVQSMASDLLAEIHPGEVSLRTIRSEEVVSTIVDSLAYAQLDV
ncbi:hypothetical protein ACLI4U_02045 [Natrialbaceae archaeon A-CW2]|uniref:hypothetical protein n=1 Tax=Natronosalvus amylolyticus TaxID=2961994 RepID=UPI0020C951F4|nr:hypothetical protein [Natronosalvus amylolyticus]